MHKNKMTETNTAKRKLERLQISTSSSRSFMLALLLSLLIYSVSCSTTVILFTMLALTLY